MKKMMIALSLVGVFAAAQADEPKMANSNDVLVNDDGSVTINGRLGDASAVYNANDNTFDITFYTAKNEVSTDIPCNIAKKMLEDMDSSANIQIIGSTVSEYIKREGVAYTSSASRIINKPSTMHEDGARVEAAIRIRIDESLKREIKNVAPSCK